MLHVYINRSVRLRIATKITGFHCRRVYVKHIKTMDKERVVLLPMAEKHAHLYNIKAL